MSTTDTDWRSLTADAAFASHRLVGWIFWDPTGTANYAALGVPDGMGYYIATRAASIAAAGNDVVAATFGSIHRGFVDLSLDLCRRHTTFDAVTAARDDAVVHGLASFVPSIVDDLGAMAGALWAVADQLPLEGRALFASTLSHRREDDALLSAWLAVNAIREWRGDTHWAIHVAEGIDGTMAGLLDAAWRGHDDDWLPRSRGADDESLHRALVDLEGRGLAEGGRITSAGVALRQSLEDRLDDLCARGWQTLGLDGTRRFIDLIAPVSDDLIRRVDETAGPRWMPAGRARPR